MGVLPVNEEALNSLPRKPSIAYISVPQRYIFARSVGDKGADSITGGRKPIPGRRDVRC
jgi:hypothetical protein